MKYFIVDAFSDETFKGNAAGVCIVDKKLDNITMQNIASENNLPETAFIERAEKGIYNLKWFTPSFEIDLCGHATLGAAFVVSNFIDNGIENMVFNTLSGKLTVMKKGEIYEMDFPINIPKKIDITDDIIKAAGTMPIEAYLSRDYIVVLDSEEYIKNFKPNFSYISNVSKSLGFVITAKGSSVDFVSRCFYTDLGEYEDSVTGSAHTYLIPYWSERLNKNKLIAKQLSKREGYIFCGIYGDRVKIGGKAALYLKGEIFI